VSAHAPEHWFGWIVDVAIAMICLLISAFVSGSEIAFFGLNQSEIENLHEEESSNTRKTCALLDNSEQLLATILISNNLVNVTMVILLTFAIGQTVTFHSSIVEFVSQTVVLTFLLLLFGEVLPKLTARGRKLVWVKRATPGIWACYKFFSPISRCMVRSTSIVGRIVTKKQENISTEELSQALEISDVKEDKDKEMLEGILTFGEKQASDIMTPRVDVTAIEYHSTWKEVISIVLDSGYSRIPVYDKSQDSIRGVLYSKDLLPYLERDGGSFTWQTLIRKAYFVPESRMLDDLLEDFRKRKIHIAIVVDEYGCTQGMVTLEDILEEIVGDIDDEYDTEDSRLYREIKPGVYRFLAKTPLVDFFRITDLDPESFPHADDVETLAGLILAVKGDFPKEKETIEAAGCHFTVLKMERHRIQSLIVKTHG
jgi:gliding motility-associated protein GldE